MQTKLDVNIATYIKSTDKALLPALFIAKKRFGKFTFYLLTIFWWNRGVSFKITNGPLRELEKSGKKIMENING